MIPSRSWFPSSLQERAAWYNNLYNQFQVVAVSLGFTAADVTALENDNNMIQFVASVALALDSYDSAAREFRITLTEAPIGDPTPVFPANPGFVAPTAVPTGIFERLDNLVKRIRVAPAYTPEIGALLGILASTPPSAPEAELKPVIKASESLNSYKFNVNVTRLGMTGYKVQIQRGGQITWTDIAQTTKNPAVVTVTPTTPGAPERIYVRAILLDGQTEVGIPSDPTYVTVNP